MSDLIIISILNIVCFLIGAKVAQMMYKNKEIKMIPNPVKMVKEYKEEKENDKEAEKYRIIAENIDNYDGTNIGQKKIGG